MSLLEQAVRLKGQAEKAAQAAADEVLAQAKDEVLEELAQLDRWEDTDLVCDAARHKLAHRRQLRAAGKLSKRGVA